MKLSDRPGWKEWLESGGHDRFKERLYVGRGFEVQLAVQLLAEGFYVRWFREDPPDKFSEERAKARGTTDLLVGLEPEIMFPIEVKSTRFSFGPGGEGFPFPAAMVMTRKAFEYNPPIATVVFSQPTGEAIVIPSFTSSQWTLREYVDDQRGIAQQSWQAPPSCWVSLDDLLTWIRAGVFEGVTT